MGLAVVQDFDNPPVSEAVMGVEFAPLPLNVVDLAGFHQHLVAEFPNVEEQLSLAPSPEAGGGISPSPIRFWFSDKFGEFLVQLQSDRLLLNWRKQGPESVYPRYAAMQTRFESVLDLFFQYVESKKASPVIVLANEFTYFNRIQHGRDIEAMFTIFRKPDPELPGRLDWITFQERRVLTQAEFGADGSILIESQPIQDGDILFIHMAITTRFSLRGAVDLAEVRSKIDLARELSRSTFVSFTTPEMHTAWGLR